MDSIQDEYLNWVKETSMSARLQNSLKRYHNIHPSDTISQITKKAFTQTNGVGKKQWEELNELRKGAGFNIISSK